MDLNGKIVLVTGANRGLGRALIGRLLDQNVGKIYAAARNIDSLDFSDKRVCGVTLDLTRKDQIQDLAERAVDVDVLINNAGIAPVGSVAAGSDEVIHQNMDVNYFGTLNLIRAFVPVFETKKSGAIVNVVTIGAFANLPVLGAYCASKSALFSLSQGLRIELAPKNISVHTVNPGPIDTEMSRPFEGAKISADDAAINIIAELQKGTRDIFPDPASQHMFALWKSDYAALEELFYGMTHAVP